MMRSIVGMCLLAWLATSPGQTCADDRTKTTDADKASAEIDKLAQRMVLLMDAGDYLRLHHLTREVLAGDKNRATAILSKVFADSVADVRSHIVDAVARAKVKEMVPVLIRHLQDTTPGMRHWCAIALGDIGDPAAVAALEAHLENLAEDEAKYQVRIALGQLGRPYLAYFVAGLSDRDDRKRYFCTVALSILQDVRSVPHLLRLLDSKKTWDPSHASTAITAITGIESTIWTITEVRPDGSMSKSGERRPVAEFKTDIEAWMKVHRAQIAQPIAEAPEKWVHTPARLYRELVKGLRKGMDKKQVEGVLGGPRVLHEAGFVWCYPSDDANESLTLVFGAGGLRDWGIRGR